MWERSICGSGALQCKCNIEPIKRIINTACIKDKRVDRRPDGRCADIACSRT